MDIFVVIWLIHCIILQVKIRRCSFLIWFIIFFFNGNKWLKLKNNYRTCVITTSDGSNNVRSSMFECSKSKIGVRVRLPRYEHVQCPFDVRNTVRRTFSEHHVVMKYAISSRNPIIFCNFEKFGKCLSWKWFCKEFRMILDKNHRIRFDWLHLNASHSLLGWPKDIYWCAKSITRIFLPPPNESFVWDIRMIQISGL